MGIRIKKVLGYGIANLQCDEDGEIIDERINPDWEEERFGKTFKGYLEFARAEQERRPRAYGDLHISGDGDKCFRVPRPELYNFVTFDSEFGLPNVLVLTPITGKEWIRYDDQIDYYEERVHGYWDLTPHFDVIDTPLYPYDNYINNETGEYPEDPMVREWIYMFRNSVIELTKTGSMSNKQHAHHHDMMQKALEELGCELHWTEKWNATIPEQIQDYCRYTQMFQNDKSIWKLLPMIYTYWS